MQYDVKKIASRLVAEREAYKLSQEKLAHELKVNRNTLSSWENALKPSDLTLKLKHLLTLSELYNCEVAYLLGEIDCKTRENTDIQAVTGLSERAIKNIKNMKRWHDEGNSNEIIVLDKLLAGKFYIVLGHIDKYIGISKALVKSRKKRLEVEKQYKEKTWSTKAEKFDVEYDRTSEIAPLRKVENEFIDKQESKLHRIQKDFIALVEKIANQEKENVKNG